MCTLMIHGIISLGKEVRLIQAAPESIIVLILYSTCWKETSLSLDLDFVETDQGMDLNSSHLIIPFISEYFNDTPYCKY